MVNINIQNFNRSNSKSQAARILGKNCHSNKATWQKYPTPKTHLSRIGHSFFDFKTYGIHFMRCLTVQWIIYLVVNTQSRNIAGIPSSFLSNFGSILASIWPHCCCKGSEWNVNLNPVGSSNFYWWYLTVYAQRPTSVWLVSYFHHPNWFPGCPHHQNVLHPRISTFFLPANFAPADAITKPMFIGKQLRQMVLHSTRHVLAVLFCFKPIPVGSMGLVSFTYSTFG